MTTPELTDDLDGWIEQGLPFELDGDNPDDAHLTELADADRLLGVLRHIERRRAEVNELVLSRTTEVKRWGHAQEVLLDRRQRHVEHLLDLWVRADHARSGQRTKTWNLPNGRLTLRPRQPRVEIISDDEDRTARELAGVLGPGANRVQHRVAKDFVKAAVAAGPALAWQDLPTGKDLPAGYRAHQAVNPPTGEVLPGIILLIPDGLRFSAKPTGATTEDDDQ